MKFKHLFTLTLLSISMISCDVVPTISEPSIPSPTSQMIDENLLVEAEVHEILPIINTNYELEDQNNFGYEALEEGISISSYSGTMEKFTIPSTFIVKGEEVPVIEIGKEAFKDNKFIKEVCVSEGIKVINESAFSQCSNLTKVKLPSTLIKIKEYAFSSINLLKEINIPSSVSEIGEAVFGSTPVVHLFVEAEKQGILWSSEWNKIHYEEYCAPIWNVKGKAKHNDLEFVLCDESFVLSYAGTKIDELIIPSKIKYQNENFIISKIGRDAFSYNNNLNKVTLSYGIQKIDINAFENSSLEYINFSETVNLIGSNTFVGCTLLKEVIIPKRVLAIGYKVFENCTSLKKVVLHENMQTIDLDGFNGCSNLEYIVIPSSIKNVRKAFLHCGKLSIYLETESIPEKWDDDWNYHQCPVFLKGEWEYKNGVPTPISTK